MPEGRNALEPVHESVAARLDAVDLTGALEEIWTLVRSANRFVEEQQPWVLARVGRARAGAGAGRRALHAGGHGALAGRDAVSVHPRPPPRRSWRPSATPAASTWERAALGTLAAGSEVHQPRAAVPARREVIDTHAHLERCAARPRRRGGRGCRRRRRAHPHDRPRTGGRPGRPPSRRVGDRRLAPARGRRGRRRRGRGRC